MVRLKNPKALSKLKIALLSFFLMIGIQGWAQDITIDIQGYVYDYTGDPLMGANVSIEGTTIGAVTDIDGLFKLQNIEVGSYNITVSFLGFESETQFNVIIKSRGNAQLNFTLRELSSALDEVVIQNSQVSRPKETPLSFQKLSAVEIATYPGGNNDVVRVAQSLPGVSPSPGGFRNDLIIRGGAPNETVYYLDGVEIPNINHFATQGSSGGPVGLLNVSFIEDVSLSTSAFGAQYDNPLSGVLQFNQRVGNKNKYTGNFRVSASEAALTFEGPLFKPADENSKTSFIVSARRSYQEFLFELIGLPFRPNYWDYQYKFTHKFNEYDELNLIGVGSIDDFSLEAPDDFDEIQQADLEQAPFIEQKTNTVGLSWKHRFKSGIGYLNTTVSNNNLINDFVRYEDNETQQNPFFQNNSTENETKLRSDVTIFKDGWKMMTGINAQYSDYSNNTIDNINGIDYQTDIDFVKYGVFINATKTVFDGKLDLSGGFRIDGDTFTEGNDFLDTFSPRMSASYDIMDDWKLNASVGKYYKLLPYTALGFRDAENRLANKNSKYTNSTHFVLGVARELSKASSISLEGFYKLYDDYPVSVRDDVSLANKGADFEVLGNEEISTVGKGRAYGLELLFQQKLSNNCYGIFSYTFFFSEFTGFDTDTYTPSVWDSRHLLSFTGGYKLPRNWEVSSRFRLAGETPFVPIDINQSTINYPNLVADYSRLGEDNLNAFSALDVRIDKKWNFEKLSLNIFLEVQNILSQPLAQPPTYGLARDASGNEITPNQLVQIDNDTGSTPIPVIGIVLDF